MIKKNLFTHYKLQPNRCVVLSEKKNKQNKLCTK